MMGAFDNPSQAANPRVAAASVLKEFVDSPPSPQAQEALRQHISPGELVLQAAQTAAASVRGGKAELGENEESEELQLVVKALQKCLAYDGVLESIVREPHLRPVLLESAESGSALLRRLLAQQIFKLTGQARTGVLLAAEAGLYQLLPGLLRDPDVGVASDASKVILASLDGPEGVQLFTSEAFWQALTAAAASDNEMVKIRVLALFVEAGRKSEELFNSLLARGAFAQLLNAFMTDDLLLKISLISLIEQLASYPRGANYIATSSIPLRLVGELADECLDDTSMVSLVYVIAEVIKQQPQLASEMFAASNGLLPRTLEGLLSVSGATPQEKNELCCAIAAWGSIAGSAPGYAAVSKAVPEFAAEMTAHFSGETEVANLAMDAWTNVLNALSDPLGPEMTDFMGPLVEAALKTHLSRPFGESRVHSYPLLRALCRWKPAVRALFASEELRRTLVDPFSEEASDAKYAKNAFLKKLVADHTEWLAALIDEGYLSKLKTFADAGPFYVPAGKHPPATLRLLACGSGVSLIAPSPVRCRYRPPCAV
ncbi:hypothetical protein BESB_071060 [Besnoitia besnoiti]|uniref:Proteasome non-ATPase 26S subunit n=1 Tax=Besnoitia besnoiti TaxID=94643 RepID=A0A2A9M9S6_BESBE|nr:uncharacterized protein BESB_071060 [Besnoitia besnoiti]PFH33954.1 hypothetical protein BESB_071060 [Besnoitia besnoiti]